MAKYDRRILIPYLEDVCSMEMLCKRLARDLQNHEGRVYQLSNYVNSNVVKPVQPVRAMYVPEFSGISTGLLVFAVLSVLCSILLMATNVVPMVGVLLLVGAAIEGYMGYSLKTDAENSNQEKYNADIKEYNEARKYYDEYWRTLPQYRQQLASEQNYVSNLKRQLKMAESLRDDVYGVNIIASKYRNIHVAYYLYDYFSTSRETDLDKILQTMLLDEIIQRLDRIIAQNEEMILNQRMQSAMLQQQNRMLSENHRQEMERLSRMERNQELQMDYQNMIARNQEVTNFFLTVDYLRKIR